MFNKRLLALIGMVIVSAGIIHAQTTSPPDVTAYTVSWTPVPGSVSLRWLNAPEGTQVMVLGDSNAGSALIGVPDGNWILDVIITPDSGSQVNGMIRFNNGSSPVIFNPSPPMGLQVL